MEFMTRYLFIHTDRCTGCRTCEAVCSMSNEKALNPAKSRIRILRSDVLELSQKVCSQCERRQCIAACPECAVYVKNDQVRIDKQLCTGCGECVKVCDLLFMTPDGSHAVMCNQCSVCVSACPEDALEIKEREC